MMSVMRIPWQALFDRGVTPDRIKSDKTTYPWYAKKYDSPMYRAYRSWKKKKEEILTEKTLEKIEAIEEVPVERVPDERIKEAARASVKELAHEVTLLTLENEALKASVVKKLVVQLSHADLPEIMKMRLLEILSRRG